MSYLIGAYVLIFIIWVAYGLFNDELKRRYYSLSIRFGLAFITGIIWPFFIAFGFYVIYQEDSERKSKLIKEKELILYHYLLWNLPDWKRKYELEDEDRVLIYTYMKEHFPDGIRVVKNPSIRKTEFAFMVEEGVKHEIHSHGFCRGVTQWYTRGRE